MVAASAKVLWWVKSCMMCLRHSQEEACVAAVGKGVIGGEVTGALGIGQKLDHVGPLKKVLPVPPPVSPQHCPLVHADPLASYCPCSSLSEGLFCHRNTARHVRELLSLEVALRQCGVGE